MQNANWTRRELLLAAGWAAGASVVPRSLAQNPATPDAEPPKPPRPITCIVIGAGSRGNVYAGYQRGHPDEWKIVGVAEPIPDRNQRMAETYGIPDEHRFVTWEHVFEKPKFADVCIITTPDNLHHGPAMAALERGYDLLLEKPIAQTWPECKDILRRSQKKGRIVAVCHVLRYTPYFREMKRIVAGGRLGRLVSVQHLEPVEHVHMSHSFVRGNWRNTESSTPIILSKSCHDLDILRWIVDRPCRKASSFGSLTLFRPEMAPPGATARCTDGCPVEATCPFSAPRIYVREKLWSRFHLNAKDDSPEAVLAALREGPYGRCVYHCDNNVPDHQITNLEFDDDITVAFSLEALTSYGGRRTRIMGTAGDLVGDEETLTVFDFSTRKRTTWDRRTAPVTSGHGGGDYGLVRDFVQAVSRQDPTLLSSTIEASMESHLMAFAAEESRLAGGRVTEIDIGKA
ncbi:Gfo/Idh/MocA family oxidoreductase [bacterium]|nr:Gfo/Idh/MocA family oxidoreductase [bacterium]